MLARSIFLMLLLAGVGAASAQEAQPATPDSLQRNSGLVRQQAPADTAKKLPAAAKEKSDPNELELEAIAIEAVIEKPNVDIIPKRVKPDFGEMRELERSFARELKSVSKGILLHDDTIDQPQKVDGLKKIPAKKKD
ncbi:hypothetical protein HUU40_06545 [candidate division KSB1 bacterium]|nr:hypothetical protein [candidate division KSB1 bacterium]